MTERKITEAHTRAFHQFVVAQEHLRAAVVEAVAYWDRTGNSAMGSVAEALARYNRDAAPHLELRDELAAKGQGVEVPELKSSDLLYLVKHVPGCADNDVDNRETAQRINAWFRARLVPAPPPPDAVRVEVPRPAHQRNREGVDMNCSTCHFGWLRTFGPNVVIAPHWPTHECRHNAPVAAVDSEGDSIPPWPLVNASDACGKWAIPGSEPSNTDPSRLLQAQPTNDERRG